MEEEGQVRKRRGPLPRKRILKWKGHKGRKWTKEERKARAAEVKARWADPEYRAQQTAARAAVGEKLRGVARRAGVPNGMRKEKAEVLNQEAKESAKETMAELEKAGVLVDDSDAAKEALQQAITIMREPGQKQTKLAAAKLVLEYTKSKPVAKQHVTVNAAEEWLKAVANDAADEGETTQDA